MMLSLRDRHFYYSSAICTDGYTPCLISGHASHTIWIHQILEDMGGDSIAVQNI